MDMDDVNEMFKLVQILFKKGQTQAGIFFIIKYISNTSIFIEIHLQM